MSSGMLTYEKLQDGRMRVPQNSSMEQIIILGVISCYLLSALFFSL